MDEKILNEISKIMRLITLGYANDNRISIENYHNRTDAFMDLLKELKKIEVE